MWINDALLLQYFPGRSPVMAYLQHLLSAVHEQQRQGFSGTQFQTLVDRQTADAYLPENDHQYEHCAGSAPQYRGYPCALWLLFHTLTVSQVQIGSLSHLLSPYLDRVYLDRIDVSQCDRNSTRGEDVRQILLQLSPLQ